MKTDKDFEQTLKTALAAECENISASLQLKARIDEQICRKQEGKYMSRINMKKIAVSVAAACLLISGSVFAGNVSGVIMSSSAVPEYKTYAEMGKAEKKIGYSADYVESFDNGYRFAGAEVTDIRMQDDKKNTIHTVKGLNVEYEKAGQTELSLTIEQSWGEDLWKNRTPDAVRTCGNTTIRYYVTTNKFVPLDYELTDEDRANMQKENYNLGVGSDSVEIKQSMNVRWEKDGVWYELSGFDVTLNSEELFDMAEQIINAE